MAWLPAGPANKSCWHSSQSLALLPCFPFQNGQNGQSSPCGKSSPSSCGQPMLPLLMATDFTPCRRKKSFISFWTFGFVVTSEATHRLIIASAPSCTITPAAILVVVLSSGPYKATVPMGYTGGLLVLRCFISYSSMAACHSSKSASERRCWLSSVTSLPVFS